MSDFYEVLLYSGSLVVKANLSVDLRIHSHLSGGLQLRLFVIHVICPFKFFSLYYAV